MTDAGTTTAGPLTHDGRILRARVARGVHGTLDDTALPQVVAALAAVDPATTGAVVLLGGETSFCTGGDVRAFAGAEDRAAYVRQLAEEFHRLVTAMVHCPVPVVAGVTGWAAGAGMSIVCAADLVVAGRGARMRPAYPGIGFSPDGGMSWTLPRLVGAGRARRILLTDEVLDAEVALAAGVVASVVDDAEVGAAVEQTAHRLAHGPTAALGRIKTLLRESPDTSLAQHLEREADAISAAAAGPEATEGLAAFVAKRPPRFH